MLRIRLTDKEIKEALGAMVILADTREQKDHVTEWLEKSKKKVKKKKLDHGDYSCMLPKGAVKGIDQDLYFDRHIVIERKKNLDELANNFSSKDDSRIKSEFAHLRANGTKVFILLEDNLYDKHIREGKYRSKYDPKTFYKRLKGFEAEYKTLIRPIHKDYMGSEIYHTLYYFMRDYLLRNFMVAGEENSQDII